MTALAMAMVDGRSVVVSGANGTVRLWDAGSGHPRGGPLSPGLVSAGHRVESVATGMIDGRPMIICGGVESGEAGDGGDRIAAHVTQHYFRPTGAVPAPAGQLPKTGRTAPPQWFAELGAALIAAEVASRSQARLRIRAPKTS